MTEIARNSAVGFRTLLRLWNPVETYGIVTLTRQIGRAKMYRLNQDSSIAKSLETLAQEIASFDEEKIWQRRRENEKTG